MFLNFQKKRKGAINKDSRVDYFRSYNQKPHQKEYSKIHQLVGKTKNWGNLSFLIFSVVIIGRELFLVSYFKKKEGIIFVFW